MQVFHGLKAVPFQHVTLILAPRNRVFNICKSFTGSHAIQGCHGATVTSTHGVEVPGMVSWYDPGSPRRNSQ
eukprot:4431553-Pyramimonas_sp.AAC.1